MDFLEDDFLILINRMVGIRPQPSSSLPTKKKFQRFFSVGKDRRGGGLILACFCTIHLQEPGKNGDKETFGIGCLSSTDCITEFYRKFSEQCLSCVEKGQRCVILVVFISFGIRVFHTRKQQRRTLLLCILPIKSQKRCGLPNSTQLGFVAFAAHFIHRNSSLFGIYKVVQCICMQYKSG